MNTEVLLRNEETQPVDPAAESDHAGPTNSRSNGPHAVARILLAPFQPRTWGAIAYLISDIPVALLGVGCFALWLAIVGATAERALGTLQAAISANPIALAIGLTATTFGILVVIPIIVLMILGARYVGWFEIRRARFLLSEHTSTPSGFQPQPGFVGWFKSGLADVVGWRALVYVAVKFPLVLIELSLAFFVWAAAISALAYPLVYQLAGRQSAGIAIQSDLPSGAIQAVVFVLGVLLLIAAAWLTRGLGQMNRLLVRSLLGPTRRSARIHELEQRREQVVEDSAGQLRRIERDLHDGTQSRLVVVSMYVGLIKARLEADDITPETLAELRTLAHSAHLESKIAMTELRDLVRNIHPAILDQGLEAALQSMASRCPLRVLVVVDLPQRLSPALETIAYYSIAELLTNAVKHSQASEVVISVMSNKGIVEIQVRDSGRGGAIIGAGSGLSGLHDRIAAVDGSLTVDSPVGGPTVVTLFLPAGEVTA